MTPPPTPPPPIPQGCIHLYYGGFWSLVDYKIAVTVNGISYGKYSFKNPFSLDIPITQRFMQLQAVLSGIRHASMEIECIPGQDVYVVLDYDRMWGSISFIRKY